jgi:hypothetical protein
MAKKRLISLHKSTIYDLMETLLRAGECVIQSHAGERGISNQDQTEKNIICSINAARGVVIS